MAWHPLGWHPAFFSEIDPFPRAVLQHHYPDVPLHGDFTTIEADTYEPIDLLVGGTPCQSFSIAGLRGGLGDDRGNLALEYLRLADRLRPDWLVWENVPGVLSSGGGRDFGAILGGMVELGYGFAYRVLDAQYVRTLPFPWAVPQRRRRVFVVGYLGDWRRAAAVLFDRESLSGHPAPRREAGQIAATTLSARTNGGGGLGADFDLDGGLVCAPVASCLNAAFGSKLGLEDQHINSGAPLFIAFDCKGTQVQTNTDGSAPTLRSMAHANSHQNAGGQIAVAFDMRGREGGAVPEGPHETANIRAASGGSSRSYVCTTGDATHALTAEGFDASEDGSGRGNPICTDGWQVRRLTPVECERLQGFPDGFTNVPWRNKDHSPDGRRYKALGNSMAVNVMRWIGDRIDLVNKLDLGQ